MNTTTLTIGIGNIEDVKQRMKAAFRGKKDTTPRYTFSSAEAMARALTPSRWSLITAMTGAGPIGVRELARRVGRDVKGVHNDAQALVLCGLMDKTGDGKLLFPYKRVKVQFDVRAAA
ncbi:MAG: transcriptional regulator [Rudaea sp.]|uniref:HVO_A0114 family putative DNA-binding protein n=1 Tax=Rudaea sp. TaxID=2136325 RepID=UPI0039E30A87